MTCKDCLHYNACLQCHSPSVGWSENDGQGCKCFTAISEWVHLPVKVGDAVYQVDSERIYKNTVQIIIYDTDGIAFDERAIGKSVFLTKEEAEKALEESRKEDEKNG